MICVGRALGGFALTGRILRSVQVHLVRIERQDAGDHEEEGASPGGQFPGTSSRQAPGPRLGANWEHLQMETCGEGESSRPLSTPDIAHDCRPRSCNCMLSLCHSWMLKNTSQLKLSDCCLVNVVAVASSPRRSGGTDHTACLLRGSSVR